MHQKINSSRASLVTMEYPSRRSKTGTFSKKTDKFGCSTEIVDVKQHISNNNQLAQEATTPLAIDRDNKKSKTFPQ